MLHPLAREFAGSKTSPGRLAALDDVLFASGLNSRIGSGHSKVEECVMRQMRAVSGTLLTGKSSFPRKALISVDLPAHKGDTGVRERHRGGRVTSASGDPQKARAV